MTLACPPPPMVRKNEEEGRVLKESSICLGKRVGGGGQRPVEGVSRIRKGLAVWRCPPQHVGELGC